MIVGNYASGSACAASQRMVYDRRLKRSHGDPQLRRDTDHSHKEHDPMRRKRSRARGFSRHSGSTLPGKSSITAVRPLMIVDKHEKKSEVAMPDERLEWLI